MSLDAAILQLEEEIDSYGQGGKAQPREGSTEWFLLRGAVLGLAFLKRAKSLNLPPAAAERLYREHLKELKHASA